MRSADRRVRSARRRASRRAAPAAALVALALMGSSSLGDIVITKDGTALDGKVLRETDEFIWVKTLSGVTKISVGDVESRTAGESPQDVYDALTRDAAKSPDSAEALWALCAFCLEHQGESDALAKEAQKHLKKVLRMVPDHEAAREANGEVRFKGEWVPRSELARLEEEEANDKERREWAKRLHAKLQMYKGAHFTLLDNTQEKDLARRGEALDEAYALVTETLGVESLWPGRSPTITIRDHDIYLGALEDFQKTWHMSEAWMAFARDEGSGGVWRDRPDPVQLRFPNKGSEAMWYSTVHMVGHLAVWRFWGGKRKPPTWLEEGLGQWVEFEILDENIASCVGTSNANAGGTSDRPKKKRGKKRDKTELTNERKEQCITALQDGEFPEMRKFLRMTMGDYGAAEEGGAYGLVVWLIGRDGEKFKELVRELRSASKDDDPWRKVYGYDFIEDMEKEWKIWVLSEW